MIKIIKYNIEIYILIIFTIMCANFSIGLEFITNIRKNIDHYSVLLSKSIVSMEMQNIQKIVGKNTIGYFGEFLAPMIYNNFNYISSPSTISFVGWNKWIIDKDVQFYKNENKPMYLLMQLYNDPQSVAEQFVITDSARAQLEIMNRYDPVFQRNYPLIKNQRLLLKKRSKNKFNISYKNIGSKNINLNEWIDVPKSSNIIETKIRLIGEPKYISLLSLLYRGPLYSIELILDNGERMEERFIPNKASEGFLVAPFIYTNHDYLVSMSSKYWGNYISSKANKKGKSRITRIEKFKIKCLAIWPVMQEIVRLDTHSATYGCANSLSIEYSNVNGLELGRLDFQITPINENDIVGKWSINNHETCIFKKHNKVYFINEYNERAMAVISGNNIYIPKWNVKARVTIDGKVIRFNNNTKWDRLNKIKLHCDE